MPSPSGAADCAYNRCPERLCASWPQRSENLAWQFPLPLWQWEGQGTSEAGEQRQGKATGKERAGEQSAASPGAPLRFPGGCFRALQRL
jgi:hypothetical protein